MAGADGIPEFVTPYNTSEFEALVQNLLIPHFNAVVGQAQVVAVDLRRLLPRARNVNGRAGMMGLDLHLAARQVARQFTQIAALHNASASAASKALAIYHGNFGGSGSATPPRAFDAGR